MSESADIQRINFHIGAPRVAMGILQSVARLKQVKSAPYLELMKPEEYRTHFRHAINASGDVCDLMAQEAVGEDPFWVRINGCQLLSASQPGMMTDPKRAFKNGQIMPQAERRIKRLSRVFEDARLDLHLTIVNQVDYIRLLQKDVDPGKIVDEFDDRAPSWYELAARIKAACPERRLLVWDFTDPARMALPFAMEMIGFDEGSTDLLTPPVNEAIRVGVLLSKILQRDMVNTEMQAILDAQYQKDLQNIDTLENTVLIRADQVPEALHVTVR